MRYARFYILSFFCFTAIIISAQHLSEVDCYLGHKYRETVNISEDHHGFIWMMRSDGFYRFDGKEMEFIDISVDLDNPSYHSAGVILPLINGDYWFAARDAGLFVYRADEDRFYRAPIPSLSDPSLPAYMRFVAQHPYDSAKVLVGGNDGFYIIDKNMNVLQQMLPFQYYQGVQYDDNSRRKNEVRKIIYDQQRDILWLGAILGLYSYDLKTNRVSRHPVKEIKNKLDNGWDSYLINDIKLDGEQLITATWFGGIMTYNPSKDAWTSFPFEFEKDQRFYQGNTQLTETAKQQIYVAHEREAIGGWKRGDQFMRKIKSDDQPSKWGIGAMVDRLGYLWIGHWGEICRYAIDHEPPQPKSAQLYIRQVMVDSTIIKKRMIRWDDQQLDLNVPFSEMQIQFRAINALDYDGIRYEYRLEGYQDKWSSNDTDEWASIRHVENGNYNFQVRYFDELSQNYIYSGKLAIHYYPEYFVSRKIVLWLLGLLLLTGIGFLAYRHYIKRRQTLAIERYEAQLREVQDAALRSQMNPHFLFNSLNSIRYFIVTNDNKKAAGYLTKFSRLIRMILEHSKQQEVSLADELQLLTLYVNMEQIRFEGKLDYEVDQPIDIDLQKIMIPPMLIQPYLENAILHGINPKEGRGKIRLEISRSDHFLLIKITDDGIGRQRSQALKAQSVLQKKSLGMSITKTRLSLVNSPTQKAKLEIIDLLDDQQKSAGTEVRIFLPMD